MTPASAPARRSSRPSPVAALLLVAALVAALLAGFQAGAGGAAAAAVPTQPHTWRNVEIVGGGFVPGIVFNEGERGLVYARTDIGGAYRLDAGTGRWVPLLDWVGWERWGWTGVAEPRGRPGGHRPRLRRRGHVHELLGPEQRRDPAVGGPRAHVAGRRAPVQARRQHAGPRDG